MTSHMDLDPTYVTTSANTLPPQITAPSVLATQPDGHTLLQTPLSDDNELDYEDSSSENENTLSMLGHGTEDVLGDDISTGHDIHTPERDSLGSRADEVVSPDHHDDFDYKDDFSDFGDSHDDPSQLES